MWLVITLWCTASNEGLTWTASNEGLTCTANNECLTHTASNEGLTCTEVLLLPRLGPCASTTDTPKMVDKLANNQITNYSQSKPVQTQDKRSVNVTGSKCSQSKHVQMHTYMDGVMKQCAVCTFLLGCADVGAVLCECHCVFSMILMQLHLPFSPFNRNLQNMVLWLMEKFYDFIRNFNCSDCNLFSLSLFFFNEFCFVLLYTDFQGCVCCHFCTKSFLLSF